MGLEQSQRPNMASEDALEDWSGDQPIDSPVHTEQSDTEPSVGNSCHCRPQHGRLLIAFLPTIVTSLLFSVSFLVHFHERNGAQHPIASELQDLKICVTISVYVNRGGTQTLLCLGPLNYYVFGRGPPSENVISQGPPVEKIHVKIVYSKSIQDVL